MRSLSCSQSFISRLLICALLLAALWPAASQALSGGELRWLEICTSGGTQWRQVFIEGTPDEPDAHAKPCPYCLLSSPGEALSSPDFRFELPKLQSSVFSPAATAVRVLAHWLPAHPRGPPARV